MSRQKELEELLTHAHQGLGGRRVNLTRGNHAPEQAALSMPMFRMGLEHGLYAPRSKVFCGNYGPPECLLGIPESREFFAEYLMVEDPAYVAALGNASIEIIDNICTWSLAASPFGYPWRHKIMMCEDPGYDRHFNIHQRNATGMRRIPLTAEGPDLEHLAEALADPNVVCMICVPQYSNPTGITYTRETIEAMAAMAPANKSFVWIFDCAYAYHHLTDDPLAPVNIWEIFKKANALNRLFLVGSLSKVTFPGEAIAGLATSERNLEWYRENLFAHLIGYPKLPQLWHSIFLPDVPSLVPHMEGHRQILGPKFDRLISILEPLEKQGLVTCTKPKGGYFIGLRVSMGTANNTVKLCGLHGLDLTAAGAPFPYRRNADDDYMRLAPSCIEEPDWPAIEQVLPAAIELQYIRQSC